MRAWAVRMWGLGEIYGGVASRANPTATAVVTFDGKNYGAWVTTGPHGRGSPAFRLWFDEALGIELKQAFLISYMRSLGDCRAPSRRKPSALLSRKAGPRTGRIAPTS